MAWKVKRALFDDSGEVYASAGEILPEDDLVAMGAKPNQVTHVHDVEPISTPEITLAPAPVTFELVNEAPPEEEAEEEEEEEPDDGDEGFDF